MTVFRGNVLGMFAVQEHYVLLSFVAGSDSRPSRQSIAVSSNV